MANTHLVLFQGRTEYPVSQHPGDDTPGLDQGIYITTELQALEGICELFSRWFAARPDVTLIDFGTSDKKSQGFLILEWRECEPDYLFLDILTTEEAILDYTLYSREVD